MSSVTELTQKGQEQFLQAVRESQQAVVEAVGAWAQTVQGIASNAPSIPSPEYLPKPEEVIDNTFELVEKLVASQHQFARDLLAATAPATPPTQSTKPAKEQK
jgi:hypothetical protein